MGDLTGWYDSGCPLDIPYGSSWKRGHVDRYFYLEGGNFLRLDGSVKWYHKSQMKPELHVISGYGLPTDARTE